MKKLSEIENDEILVVGNGSNGDLETMTKEDFLNSAEYLDIFPENKKTYPKVTIGDKTVANFDFDDMLECEAEQMYEDWEEVMSGAFTSEQMEKIREAETIVNLVFNEYPTYYEGEALEIDIFDTRSDVGAKNKCAFDKDGICTALCCYSSKECNSKDDQGNPLYGEERGESNG